MFRSLQRFIMLLKTQLAIGVATVCVFWVDKALHYKGYRWTSRWLMRLSPTPDPTAQNHLVAIQTARLIQRAANRTDASCLRRSLLLWWWLRWKGLPTDVRIGINAKDGHAWVVHHDVVINDRLNVANDFVILDPARVSPSQIARLLS